MSHIDTLNKILLAFKIAARCQAAHDLKNATHYDLVLAPGTRIQTLERYATELSLALKSPSKPRVRPFPEQGIVRLEFLKPRTSQLNLFDTNALLSSPPGKLSVLLGETLEGQPLWLDMVNNPHLLVAGCTGSGKSTLLHTMIANLLCRADVYSILMDPKNIEFYRYAEIPNAKLQVNFEFAECMQTLEWLCAEMETRYTWMRQYQMTADQFDSIVLIIDEYADLVSQDINKQFRQTLCRLAQKSRAAGIHIVLATQRPSATIVDGDIKANFATRIACKVATKTDARVVLDSNGAENLAGKGDAILSSSQHDLLRFQVAYTAPDQTIGHLTGWH